MRADPSVSFFDSWLPRNDYLYVDFELNESNQNKKSVFKDPFMILFVLIMFTCFTLVTYAIIRIGDKDETFIQAKQN